MHSSRRDGVYGTYTGQQYNAYQSQQQYGHQNDDNYNSGYPGDHSQHSQQTYQAYSHNQSSSQGPGVGPQEYAGPYHGGRGGMPTAIQTESYNPADYAVSGQPLTSPTISSPRLAMPAGNYAAAHVPYNPAAYSSASPSIQQGNAYQSYQSTPSASYGQFQTPPLPPKPPELTQQTSSPYPRASSDRRGAVASGNGPDSYRAYIPQSPQNSYASYTPPIPPAPPGHGVNASGTYQAYAPPSSQSESGPPPPPPEHRRLPSLSQDGGLYQNQSPGLQQADHSWTSRFSGASHSSTDHSSTHQLDHRTTSSASTASRPLPPPPDGQDALANGADLDGQESQMDAAFAGVEALVNPVHVAPSQSISRRPVPSRQPGSQPTPNGSGLSPRPDSLGIMPHAIQTHSGGLHPESFATSGPLSAYPEDSDPEGTAGAEAMLEAEQNERSRHQSLASVETTSTAVAPAHDTLVDSAEESDDYQYGFMDEPFHPGFNRQSTDPVVAPLPDRTNSLAHFPPGDYGVATLSDPILSPHLPARRVDTGGTGGLAEPAPRRMSFEDGDEMTLVETTDNRSSTSISPTKLDDGFPRRSGSGRPLPPTPSSDSYLSTEYNASHATSYESNQGASTDVRKTFSLSGPVNTAGPGMPGRSITDAEQRRRHGNRASYYNAQTKSEAAFPGPGELQLPVIPAGRRRKFIPSKLSSKDYAECDEPWAISGVLSWIRSMTEGETDLKEQPIVDAIVGLFTHKVPTMNIADAEVLSANLVAQMIYEAALVRDEEWVKFSPLKMSGVIYQLTGTGCYSSRVHTTTMQGRCYSQLCMRTLKKIDLQAQRLAPEKMAQDWTTFYGLTEDDLKEVKAKDPKKIELQYMLHEIVTSEDFYVDQLDVLLILYRDGLAKNDKPIIALMGKQSKFINEVFGKVPAVKKVNEEHLLSQLKYRQQEQGPWIVGFADIFRNWIRQSRAAYVDYAVGLPNAISQMRKQSEQNVLFKQFLDQVREHPRSKRLDWQTYLKAPITRLQRYGLLLATVHKTMKTESQEKTSLAAALKEIKEATHECDAKYAEHLRRADMAELSEKLKLRPGMEHVQLALTQMGRQIIHRGELSRRGNNNINWVETQAILFDHMMVLSKPIRTKDSTGTIKSEYYDVSKLPIPMDLLVLESADDGTVMKHSVKGIVPLGTTAVSKPTGPGTPDPRLARTTTGPQSNGMPPAGRTLSSPTIPSPSAVNSATVTGDSENLLYPFRIQHLGKSESYVLYASSPQVRQEWAEKITLAKQQHAAALHAQNAEPFQMRVLADTAFAYSNAEYIGVLPVHIQGTPLDRALRDLERDHGREDPRPTPVCRSPVNCATAFTPPSSTRRMLAVGTDFGVFITEQDSPRGWYKAINATHVTQITVLEDFSVLLIIADKSLIAFHLDAVCPPQGGPPTNTNDQKRTPQKLSGSRDVGFFAVGRMKERMLVFYKKKDGISSTFKVLEPVYHKSSTASSSGSGWGRSRFGLKKGTTEFFRDFDDFYIATDTYAINIFASSLGIATQKGIEVLTLDKKVPFSIPELRAPEVQSIAQRIRDQRPLGMFRLTDSEFLLVFEEVGIYVDKHGEISRAVVMEFVGKARQAALHHGTYLVLVDSSGGFVEVRNAMNGRLRQVVPGKDVKMLDDGMASGATSAGTSVQPGVSRGTIKISMMHPELDRGYVVLELLLNAGTEEGV